MYTTDTLIIGGGQAGLALSRCLTDRAHDHLVLERGRVAERWHSERWDSLRLLTPNWMSRLPGFAYSGDEPDGFMTAREVARFFTRYSETFAAPIVEHNSVRHVKHDGDRFVVASDNGGFRSNNVVIATGWCDRPAIPAVARELSPRIHQVVPSSYRRPADVPAGGVLVVGASATGVQLAHDLQRSGRTVTLAVGSHSRMPRRYRGMDTFWWLDQIGTFDRTVDDVDDVVAARNEPSLQLVGRPDHSTIDLPTLQGEGVRLVGRLNAIDNTRVSFAPEVGAVIAAADEKMRRMLDRIDDSIERSGLSSEVLERESLTSIGPLDAPTSLDLVAAGINSIVWATGHRRSYEWLDLPIFDFRGEIRQHRGITPFAGAYVLGQRFQHYRNSSFIDGVGRDAEFVARHICNSPNPQANAFVSCNSQQN